jgi:hypothetical protein
MSKARSISKLTPATSGVVSIAGTAALKVPVGTTAERPSGEVGLVRYNSTTGFTEVYNSGVGWTNVGVPPPTITSVTPVTYNGESGTSFTITGANFTSDAGIKFVTNDGTEYPSATVTFVNSIQITATTPQDFTVAQEPLDIKLTQASGTTTLVDCIDCGGTPTWTTTAGSLGTIYDSMRATATLQVAAVDPDSSATISYSVVSGALPTGMTLNSSTGAITGTASAVVSDTTYNFTIRATDNAGNTSDRAFSSLVKAPVVQIFSYTGSDQTWNKPTGLTAVTAYMWGAAGGGAAGEGYSDAGGAGGYASGIINLTSISTLLVQVGAGGGQGRGTRAYPNGGLPAVRSGYTSGCGGGRSALFNTSVSAANSLLIAGGGGGGGGHGYGSTAAGYNYQGGNGGGTESTGSMGYRPSGVVVNGNTELTDLRAGPSNGGTNTSPTEGKALGRSAAQFQGADAGTGTSFESGGWNAAGGGGDGWYGGGVQDSMHGGGGGGSGYYNSSFVTSQTLSTTAITGGKKTTINPPQTASAYYSAGIGVGTANATGGNGRIVLVY